MINISSGKGLRCWDMSLVKFGFNGRDGPVDVIVEMKHLEQHYHLVMESQCCLLLKSYICTA